MKWKNSITKQFLVMNGIFFVVLAIGLITLLMYEVSLSRQFVADNLKLKEKEEIVQSIEYEYNQSILQSRGYVAFSNQLMLEDARSRERIINQEIERLANLVKEEHDLKFVNTVTDFQTFYFREYLPQIEVLFEQDAIEEIHDYIINQGASQKIVTFREYVKEYRGDVNQEVRNNIDRLYDRLQVGQLLFGCYVLFVLALLFAITWKLIRKIGKPLRVLAEAAENITKGKHIKLPSFPKSTREITVLSDSFNTMVTTLQYKEEELVGQNEELIAQQDELIAQQDELQAQQEQLQDTLHLVEESKEELEVRNTFIHEMAETLNRQHLLDSVIRNMGKVLGAHVGIILLLDEKKTSANIGLAKESVENYKTQENSVFLQQLKDTKKAFAVKRSSYPSESSYHSSEMYAFDVYVPIIAFNGEMIAYMQFTRFDSPFNESELETSEALSKQVSMALEKVELYENSEAERLFYQDIINTIQEGILLVDVSGKVLQSNTKMCALLNYPSPNRLLNLSFEEWATALLDGVDDKEHVRNQLIGIFNDLQDGDQTFIFDIKHNGYQNVIKVYREKVYRQNQSYGYILVFRDITKEFEVDKMKSEFVSTVSHELRTPLASVLGFTERMIYKDLSEERKKTYLTTIFQEANRLTGLINDFLDVQRMEAGKQEYHKTKEDMVKIVKNACGIFEGSSITHPIHFHVLTDQTNVLIDKEKLTQVFTNIISNAIKYSPSGGDILITISEQNQQLQIEVQDHGMGIPENAIQHLFTKFYRVDNSDLRKIGGTGLGLSIVREIVHAHEGEVWINSKEEKGTKVTILLPLEN
ncbi:ATP-binding protein [Sutcliffiella rhizosphaerae]|uniref:histidine kinase n=1 Tax=Sutcliffiella rhizosphaerae TaxID=2880967 RepID=A0ABM8YR75_9BACI|nr:ATP-binding protein [Sutcliffiella rhizosphaerae]CAG9622507.1 Adaptive-response sensory-kinase SasA [Sutcliffiella rhizosphaerae]